MKIVILDGHTANPGDLSWEGLEALGELTVYDRTAKEDIVSRIGDAEAVIVNKTPLDEAVFSACPQIRYVGVLATGYNIVDTAAAAARGIPVCNVPAYSTDAVAQLTFALLLEICHHVGAHSQAVMAGEWSNQPDFSFWKFPLIELAGKTMGIIGFGRIGKAVGRLAKLLGMRVLATGSRETEEGREIAQYVTLDELLASSDVVSLHCPLFPETKELINRNTIAKMKDGAILLNTGRGPLIHEGDVAEAVKSGKLYAFACDVTCSEPIEIDNPLLGCENVFITPHFGWAPKDTRVRLLDVTTANLKAFLDGKPQNVVNGI